MDRRTVREFLNSDAGALVGVLFGGVVALAIMWWRDNRPRRRPVRADPWDGQTCSYRECDNQATFLCGSDWVSPQAWWACDEHTKWAEVCLSLAVDQAKARTGAR